jgi:trimethylamine--corrinoid protein Co-methyltransferase
MVHDYALPINMKTGAPNFGAIEAVIHQAVFNQIWRFYGIPSISTNAGPTNTKKIDFQGGYEKAMSALSAALTGVNVIQFSGGLYGELAAHPIQAILDDDIAGMVGRYLEGVRVDTGTLALDLIDRVGPIPGHYVGQEHTREWWKREYFIPRAADRLPLPEWLNRGKKDCLDYARERLEDILATHEPQPLTDAQEAAVEDILREARDHYRKRGLISDSEWKAYMGVLGSADYPYSKY